MRTNWILAGVGAGTVAAAAAAGALIGFGVRLGGAARPFNAMAGLLLGSAAQRSWGATDATLTGVLLLVVYMAVCGAVFGWLVAHAGRPWAWSIVIAAIVFSLSSLAGRATGRGLSVFLPLGDRLMLAALLVVALPLGMRFAFSSGTHSPAKVSGNGER